MIKSRKSRFSDGLWGGNKARKALEYEKLLRSEGYNAIVTCGGIHSNHNRAMALMAMANGWECHLVYQFWFILGYIAMIYRKYLNILFSILIIVVWGFIERASLLYALLGIYAIYLLSLRLTYLTRFTFINKVNSNIFGIYLFHPVIIYLFFYYLDKSEIGVLPITVSVVVISFILSFYLTELMRKLHLNLLIGEKRQNDRHK